MKIDRHSDKAGTDRERSDFRGRLKKFREGLPPDQRKAFNGILAGARAAFKRNEKAGPVEREIASFAQALSSFRTDLSPREREAFTSITTAASFALGVAAERARRASAESSAASVEPVAPPAPGTSVIYMGLLGLLHLTPLAVIATGAYLIVDELMDDDEEQSDFPDLSGIPMSPEEIP